MREIVQISGHSLESLARQASFKGFVESVHGSSMTMVAVDDNDVALFEFVVNLRSSQIRDHSRVPIVPGHPFTWERSEQGGVVVDDVHFDPNFHNYNGWITSIDDDTFTVLIRQGRRGFPFSWKMSKSDVKPADFERIILGYGIGFTSPGRRLRVSDMVFTEPKFTPNEISEIRERTRALFSFLHDADEDDGKDASGKLSSM